MRECHLHLLEHHREGDKGPRVDARNGASFTMLEAFHAVQHEIRLIILFASIYVALFDSSPDGDTGVHESK